MPLMLYSSLGSWWPDIVAVVVEDERELLSDRLNDRWEMLVAGTWSKGLGKRELVWIGSLPGSRNK